MAIYPDKKKNPILIETPSIGIHHGLGDQALEEETPEYLRRSSDFIIGDETGNNTQIVFGRDRWAQQLTTTSTSEGTKTGLREVNSPDPEEMTLVSGYSNHQGAGSIDIVVGRGAPYPHEGPPLGPLYTTVPKEASGFSSYPLNNVDDPSGESDHPGTLMDAARIYISQMCDIDRYFDIDHAYVGHDDPYPSSAIMMKADRLRMHSRRDIKIIAGGDRNTPVDSNGYPFGARPKIHLIVGNGMDERDSQQAAVLGDNLVSCIKRIYQCQQNILEIVNNLAYGQMALNTVMAHSIRVLPPILASAPDPVSQAAGVIKALYDAKDFFNIFIEKFYNIPMDEFSYLNAASEEYILSRNITIN